MRIIDNAGQLPATARDAVLVNYQINVNEVIH